MLYTHESEKRGAYGESLVDGGTNRTTRKGGIKNCDGLKASWGGKEGVNKQVSKAGKGRRRGKRKKRKTGEENLMREANLNMETNSGI